MALAEVRTQIYLPSSLHRALLRVARRRRVSMAHVIREAAEAAILSSREGPADPFEGLIGAVPGARDASAHHDRHLVAVTRKRR